MIEDYIKQTSQKLQDVTAKVQTLNNNIEWQILAGKSLHFTKMKNRDDRIEIQYALNFSSNDQKILIVGKLDVEEILMDMNQFAISSELRLQWNTKDGVVTGFIIHTYIDVDDISRSNIFTKWDKVTSHGGHIAQRLLKFTNPKGTATEQDTSDKPSFIQ